MHIYSWKDDHASQLFYNDGRYFVQLEIDGKIHRIEDVSDLPQGLAIPHLQQMLSCTYVRKTSVGDSYRVTIFPRLLGGIPEWAKKLAKDLISGMVVEAVTQGADFVLEKVENNSDNPALVTAAVQTVRKALPAVVNTVTSNATDIKKTHQDGVQRRNDRGAMRTAEAAQKIKKPPLTSKL